MEPAKKYVRSELDTPIDTLIPIPSPRHRRRQRLLQEQHQMTRVENGQPRTLEDRSDSSQENSVASVKDRIKQFNSSSSEASSPKEQSPNDSPKLKIKQKPSTKAFEVFENQGIIIGM
ncbi:uncharacterized protein LOC102801498, partial [Saccoglossus kowalevskii]|uniref:Uncharacterized protein LOC102801498 n=1 Tax=Saccoglossus kowalevskii TaxID=10224 RepID=A0ABM0LU33_SACKO